MENLNRLSTTATQAGFWEGVGREQDAPHTAQFKPRNAFTPSRRSGTQAGTARLRGLTPPSRASALSRDRHPSLPRDPPTTGSEPNSASPPGSPPPPHTCRRMTPKAVRARPSRPCPHERRFPARRTSPAPLSAPGSNPPDARPSGARAQRCRPRRAPRALTPLPALSPPRALTREDTHTLRLSLTGRAAPRAPAGVLAHPAAQFCLAVRGGGEGRQWPWVLTHRRAVRAPSARRSAVRRCATMRAVPASPQAMEETE